jgi:hypothetical protein
MPFAHLRATRRRADHAVPRAALNHIYRFINRYNLLYGKFHCEVGLVAFFPGTFDPFALSHKGIVQAIRDLGFDVPRDR